MPSRITASPNPDQYCAVSTVTRPVTHTADTAVKTASGRAGEASPSRATGSDSKAVNTATMPAKAVSASRAGEERATSSMLSRSQERLRRRGGRRTGRGPPGPGVAMLVTAAPPVPDRV